MPRVAGVSIPKYRKHRPTAQAVVTIGGVDHYLGPHGTKASQIEYDRLIAEWMANGRQLRITADAGLILAELIKRYREHVRQHYVKNGRPTSEQHDIACALRFVRELYYAELVSDFGPLALKAVRRKMVEAGYARSTVNDSVHRSGRLPDFESETEVRTLLPELRYTNDLRGKTLRGCRYWYAIPGSEPGGPPTAAVGSALVRFQPPEL